MGERKYGILDTGQLGNDGLKRLNVKNVCNNGSDKYTKHQQDMIKDPYHQKPFEVYSLVPARRLYMYMHMYVLMARIADAVTDALAERGGIRRQ
jgi:hypothetical protein